MSTKTPVTAKMAIDTKDYPGAAMMLLQIPADWEREYLIGLVNDELSFLVDSGVIDPEYEDEVFECVMTLLKSDALDMENYNLDDNDEADVLVAVYLKEVAQAA